MNQEIKKENISQEINLINQKHLEITGVKKLESLNKQEFIVNTVNGILVVRGQDLEMKQLDIEKGILFIEGIVFLLEYEKTPTTSEQKKSFFSKLFK